MTLKKINRIFECFGIGVFITLIYCYRSLLISVVLIVLIIILLYFIIPLVAYKLTGRSVFFVMRKYTPSANIFDIMYHYLSTYLYNSSYHRLYHCLYYFLGGGAYQNN